MTTDEYAIFQTERKKKIEELENMDAEHWTDRLLLKFWTLKGYQFENNPRAAELIGRYFSIWVSASVISQKDTQEQKQIICEIIDCVDWIIVSDWSGEYFTKEKAKEYILSQ